jgi:hypothetical protein
MPTFQFGTEAVYISGSKPSYTSVDPNPSWCESAEFLEPINGNQEGVTWNLESEVPRLGISSQVWKHEEMKPYCKKLVQHYYKYGWDSLPGGIPVKFMRTVNQFRITLELWEKLFSLNKWMCKEELYVHSLEDGADFTDYVKKARAYAVQEITSRAGASIPEEFEGCSEGYDGYDSILAERNFIHWHHDNVDDVKYAFFPPKGNDTSKFKELATEWFLRHKIRDNWAEAQDTDWRENIKGTVIYSHKLKKSILQRELFFMDELPTHPGWFAKRCVVQALPGGPRDTGVPDISTWKKLKNINAVAALINDISPKSAAAASWKTLARYKLLMRHAMYIHVDFKKYGLTCPRDLMICLGEVIYEQLDVDIREELEGLNEFLILMEDGSIRKSCRGSMLGWLDSLVSIITQILVEEYLRDRKIKGDFLSFADDMEIGIQRLDSDIPRQVPYLDDTEQYVSVIIPDLVQYLRDWDFCPSDKKIYGSYTSVFLENYHHFDCVGLNMYKGQLILQNYARAAVTEDRNKARMLYSSAAKWYRHDYADLVVMGNRPVHKRLKNQYQDSILFGGWQPVESGMICTELYDRSIYDIACIIHAMKKVRYAPISTKRIKVTGQEETKFSDKFWSNADWYSNPPQGKFDDVKEAFQETRREHIASLSTVLPIDHHLRVVIELSAEWSAQVKSTLEGSSPLAWNREGIGTSQPLNAVLHVWRETEVVQRDELGA